MTADYEAVITLPLLGPAGQMQEIEAVIDTGFNRFLALPSAVVSDLGLAIVSGVRVTLADGSEVPVDVCGVTVLWDGQPRYVDTYVAGGTPLVGMALLESHKLYVEVSDGGRVVIEPTE